jgi:tRNA(fMet)-specific endonuclease VapC
MNGHRNVLNAFRRHRGEGLFLSSIVLGELEFGVAHSTKIQQNRIVLDNMIAGLMVIPFDGLEACVYGAMKAQLTKNGNTFGKLDMLIAAHALAQNLTLVTHNTREFSKVPGLRIVDWME